MSLPSPAYIAFLADRRIAAGELVEVARTAKERLEVNPQSTILILDGQTSRPIDLDFRGSVAEMVARLPPTDIVGEKTEPSPSTPRGPGRPKLGVVAREVTLLPRHWEWLARQPGGASVALRKLVETARRNGEQADHIREAQESTYRFLSIMAGNRPHYEDAIRALFADDRASFDTFIEEWPDDIRDHARQLAAQAFGK